MPVKRVGRQPSREQPKKKDKTFTSFAQFKDKGKGPASAAGEKGYSNLVDGFPRLVFAYRTCKEIYVSRLSKEASY